MRHVVNIIMWSSRYTEPPRGWPRVLAVGVDVTHAALLGLEGLTATPIGYATWTQIVETESRKQARDPGVLLRQRHDRVRNRMERKFPLFAEEMIQRHRRDNPEYYDIDAIRDVQEMRQRIYDGYTDLDAAVEHWRSQMAGNDGWRDWDWADIRRRWVKHMKRQALMIEQQKEKRKHRR